MEKTSYNDRAWPIGTITQLDPGISRATAQDWLQKGLAAGDLIPGRGGTASYLFTPAELVHFLVLAALSRFGVLRVRDVQESIHVDIHNDPAPEAPGATTVLLTEPAALIEFYRREEFNVGVIVQWTVQRTSFLDWKHRPDRRVKTGELRYWLSFRPKQALEDYSARWYQGSTSIFPSDRARALGLISVAAIYDDVDDELRLRGE